MTGHCGCGSKARVGVAIPITQSGCSGAFSPCLILCPHAAGTDPTSRSLSLAVFSQPLTPSTRASSCPARTTRICESGKRTRARSSASSTSASKSGKSTATVSARNGAPSATSPRSNGRGTSRNRSTRRANSSERCSRRGGPRRSIGFGTHRAESTRSCSSPSRRARRRSQKSSSSASSPMHVLCPLAAADYHPFSLAS